MKVIILYPFNLFIMSMICVVIMFAACEQDPEMISDPNSMTNENYTNVKPENKQMLTVSSDNLTEGEIASLMFMVEEEQLARDVYLEMLRLYGLKIFDNISQSEKQHVSVLTNLIEKYELDNPNDPHVFGIFENQYLQGKYYELIAWGSISVSDAIAVGVYIEILDINDIQYYLDNDIESEDIVRVYENLIAGSVNHLAAFESHQE